MKLFRLSSASALCFLLLTSQCQDKECPSTSIPITPLTESLPCFTKLPTNIGQSTQVIIQSAAEFTSAFPCASTTSLDFTKCTVLAGATQIANGGRVTSQEVNTTCTGYKYTVHIFDGGVSTAITTLTYFAVVPKLPNNAQVNFDIQIGH